MVKHCKFCKKKDLLERHWIRRREMVFRRVDLYFIDTHCLYSVLFI